MQTIDKHIQALVETVIREKLPEKIVLFGSHVRQEAKWDSDVDLLVVMETDLEPLERVMDIKKLLHAASTPLDILVYTPEEVAYWSTSPSSFISQILSEGHILYDRSTAQIGQAVG